MFFPNDYVLLNPKLDAYGVGPAMRAVPLNQQKKCPPINSSHQSLPPQIANNRSPTLMVSALFELNFSLNQQVVIEIR
ncbi:MAG: hypothetical protein AAGA83_25505, partial [Cyanobacteria bacterium P01_F01_bin.116]